MRLVLSVIGPQGEAMGAERERSWVDAGGTIGRADNNDWVLPDPRQEISRCHARVRFVGGAFYLEDTSANGIFVDTPDNRLSATEPHRLRDGETLLVGDYRIRVALHSDSAAGAEDVPPPSADEPQLTDPDLGTAADPLDLLGGAVETPPEGGDLPRESGDSGEPGYLQDHYQPAPVRPEPSAAAPPPAREPPAPQRGEPVIPTDWWRRPSGEEPPAGAGAVEPPQPSAPQPPAPPPPPAAPEPPPEAAPPPAEPPREPPGAAQPEASPGESPIPRPGAGAGQSQEPPAAARAERPQATGAGMPADALQEMLRGAGMDPERLSPEAAQTLGRILRLAVEGLMDLLRARMEVKNQFRMSVTLIQARENNPLKFSTSAEDALHNLLLKNNPDYMGPLEAFEAAFDDLRTHQMAMMAGMREAFFNMLDRFDPDELEEIFHARGSDRSVLGRVTGPKPWEQYKGIYQDLRNDTEGAFNRLFGEAFVKAYERQVETLKGSVGGQRRNG